MWEFNVFVFWVILAFLALSLIAFIIDSWGDSHLVPLGWALLLLGILFVVNFVYYGLQLTHYYGLI